MPERTNIRRYVKLVQPETCGGCHRPLDDGWKVFVREEWNEGDIYFQGKPNIVEGLSKLAAEMIYSRELLNGSALERY